MRKERVDHIISYIHIEKTIRTRVREKERKKENERIEFSYDLKL